MTRNMIRIGAFAILALVFALLLAPIAALAREQCKPAGPQYIHAVEQRPNWVVYWWCDYRTIDWVFITPGHETAERLEAATQWRWGMRPGYLDEAPWVDPLVIEQMRAGAMAIARADTNRPPKPPEQKWWVQSNGSTPTRPSYPVIDGKRGTTSDGRATVGVSCDCATPIIEGKVAYCRFATGGATASMSTSVAVCSQMPPAAPPAANPPTGSPPLTPPTGAPPGAPPPKPPAAGAGLKMAHAQ